MKQPRRGQWLPFLSLLLGGVGFALQLWLLYTGVDEKGLVLEHHPAVLPLWLLSVLMPVVLGLLALTVPKNQIRFSEKNGLAFWIWGGLTVFLFVFSMVQYRIWSAESQSLRFLTSLLATLSLLLFTYFRAALAVGIKKPRHALFAGCCAIFYCTASLSAPFGLVYLFALVWLVLALFPKNQAWIILPEQVVFCMQRLEASGYSAYAVGGCVRDSLLGTPCQDYDLCTSATPEEIAAVFGDLPLVRNGEKHGTIGVIYQDKVYEITTYRKESGYSDCRHPDEVCWCGEIEEDLARRDFTINAMAYHPQQGLQDPWGGQKDLRNRVLRTVGAPAARFGEDALRILRGVRFAMRFQLTPEDATLEAMCAQAPLLQNIARERVFDELCKLLPLANAHTLCLFAPVLVQAIPELAPALNFHQHTRHHAYDVYRHTARVVAAAPKDLTLLWAALLHDVAKPATFAPDEAGNGHFPDHAALGAEMASDILLRLHAPTALREQVVFLIANHMLPLPPDRQILRRRIGKYGSNNVRALLALQKADYAGKGVYDGQTEENMKNAQRLLEEILSEEACLCLKDLVIGGDDLLALGFPEGKEIGACLNALFQQVLEETLPNEKEALLEAAKASLENRR